MVKLYIWKDGDKYWAFNTQLHRANGPAIDRPNNNREWWWYDRSVTEYELMMLAGQETASG